MKTFTVTEDHLKLLKKAWAYWEDSEFGAPSIDCKRPYGNSSVIFDIAEILDVAPDDDDELKPETRRRLEAIHKGTETALQIALATGKFEAGDYVASTYGINWEKEAAA